MGAEQSYQKAKSPTVSFKQDIEDLQEYLKKPIDTIKIGKEYNINDINLDKYSLFDLLNQSISKEDTTKIRNDSKLLDKIKISLDMYVLYDNYNVKHKVMITDLSKKLENQNKYLKGRSEEIDVLNYKLKDLKINNQKDKKTNLLLIIGIIILIILICILCFLIYLKVN